MTEDEFKDGLYKLFQMHGDKSPRSEHMEKVLDAMLWMAQRHNCCLRHALDGLNNSSPSELNACTMASGAMTAMREGKTPVFVAIDNLANELVAKRGIRLDQAWELATTICAGLAEQGVDLAKQTPMVATVEEFVAMYGQDNTTRH